MIVKKDNFENMKIRRKKNKKKIANIWGKGGFSKIKWLEEKKNIYIYIYIFIFHVSY